MNVCVVQDAMGVARNIAVDSRLVPGGGAIEMAVSHALQQKAAAMETVEALPYRSVAKALEVIPRTLIGNCGACPSISIQLYALRVIIRVLAPDRLEYK